MRRNIQVTRLRNSNHIINYSLQIFLSVGLWVAAAFMLVIFVPLRFTVDKVLKRKYGDRYGGLMDKADSFYLEHNTAMETFNTSLLIFKAETKRDFVADIGKALQERVLDKGDDYAKLTGSIKMFFGYAFIIKGITKLEDILIEIDKPKSKPFDSKFLENYIARINSGHFASTNNGRILWNIHLSKEHLDDSEDGHYRYPVIVRFHHGLCDGTSLIDFLIRAFGGHRSRNYCEELFQKIMAKRSSPKKEGFLGIIKKNLEYLQFWLHAIFLSTGRMLLMNQFKRKDKNALHGPKLSGKKLVAFIAEAKPECIPMIKKMRQHDNSIKFTSVISTAIAESFTNYFRKNSLPVPEFVTGILTTLTDFPYNDPDKPVPFKNKTTASILELPMTHQTETLYKSLGQVTHNMSSQIRFADILMTRLVVVHLNGFLPINVFGWLYGMRAQTFLLTNIPGGSTVTLLDGYVIEKLIPFAANISGIGVTIAIISYDDRFQIGIQVDQSLINSQKQVDQMTKDILESIRRLNAEVSTNLKLPMGKLS